MAGALPVWRYFEVLDNNYYFVSHQTNPGANYSTFFRNSNSASAVILDDITATTSFTNEIADSATVTTGTETNTFASTAVRDGVYHQVDNVGNVIDYFYEFDMGVGVNGNQCTIFGRYNGTGGDSINVDAELLPGAEARIEHRGTKWTVRNVGEAPIPAGARATVVEVDGLTLRIKA